MSVAGVDATRRVVRDSIVALCARDLPPLELLERVGERLRAAIPYAVAGWLTSDPHTLLYTGAVAQLTADPVGPHLAARHQRLWEGELRGDDVLGFTELARDRRGVRTLSDATNRHPERSRRLREIYRPLDLGRELRAVFRTGRACWGLVCLVRRADDPDFSAAEVQLVSDVAPHIGHGLRTSLLLESGLQESCDSPPGMLVLDESDHVELLTDAARYWLDRLPITATTGEELPTAVYAVAHRARTAAHGAAETPARARVRLADGRWLLLHAACLHPTRDHEARIAVVLELAPRAHLAPLLLDLHELTTRERHVTHLLLRGLSTTEIARELWISPHTAHDHTKAIFAKLGVRSRADLATTLCYDRWPSPGTAHTATLANEDLP